MIEHAIFSRVEEAARHFEPATPDLLASRVLQNRQDWKFLLPLRLLPRILSRLAASHATLWAGSVVLARYETQYFDTRDRLCFHDHRRGRPRRYKVRARTYPDRSVTMLEVKRKQPGITDKKRMSRSFLDHHLDSEGRDFIGTHSRLHPDLLRPALTNSFRRLTLLGRHAEQRVTFDLDISVSEGGRSRSLRHIVVAEVKSSSSRLHTPALRCFSELGLRPSSMSKYCVGTALLHPSIRANRFLPMLRTLSQLEAA